MLLNPPETFPGACSPTDATSPGGLRPGVLRGQVSKDRPCPQLQGTEPHTPMLTPSPCSLSPCLPVPHPQPSTWSVSLVPAAHTAHTTRHTWDHGDPPHPFPFCRRSSTKALMSQCSQKPGSWGHAGEGHGALPFHPLPPPPSPWAGCRTLIAVAPAISSRPRQAAAQTSRAPALQLLPLWPSLKWPPWGDLGLVHIPFLQ